VIVVDDKSKNGQLIESFCNNYSATYLRNTANSSMPQRALARNIGLSHSSGDIIVFSDMDIIYSEDAKAFHMWREITSQERYLRLNSVLTNIEYMCKKFPELAQYERLIQRRKEVEELIAAMKS